MKIDKKKLIMVMAAVLAGAGLIIGYFWYQNAYYVSTIDARVNSKMANVVSMASGKLVTFNCTLGQQVSRDEKLGTIDGGATVTSLNSPIGGTIVKVNVSEGQTLTAGQTAAVVADMNNLYVSANIEETDIAKCSLGQGVEIKLDAYSGKVIYGRISSIGDAAVSMFSTMSTQNSNGNYSKITQLIPIEIELAPGYPKNLKIGMNAKIKIYVKKDSKAIEAAFKGGASGGTDSPYNGSADERVLTGMLEPVESYSIKASVAGKVTSVLVENGMEVKAGTILVKQDPTDVQNQAGQGSTSSELLEKLRVSYELAEETYQKNKTLYEAGAISESAYRQSETQRNTALLQYQGTAKLVAEQTTKTNITSHGPGIVTELNLKPGDMLNAGSPVATIVDVSSVVVTVKVPENWIGTLAEGDTVSVLVESLGESVKGIITYISPVASSSGQLFPVKIKIDNTDGSLKPGMSCAIDFK